MEALRRRTHEILEAAPPGDRPSFVFDIGIITLIGLNALSLILESVPSVRAVSPGFFHGFEVFSVAVFTVEYLLRLWSATAEERFRKPVRGRLRYAATPHLVVDLLAILPFYLPWLGVDLRGLRALRLFRILRIFKLARYFVALRSLGRAVTAKREELVVTLSVLGLLLVVASSVIYYVEHPVQPETFRSIPDAMWWGIATLTTVGYGDMYPITPLGRAMGGVIAVLGIGMIALPTGILGAAFMDELERARAEKAAAALADEVPLEPEGEPFRVCPHCGGDLRRPPEP